MSEKIDRLGQWLERIGGFVVTGLGLVMGIALTYYSGFYTEICMADEHVGKTVLDNPLKNVFLLFVLFLALRLLRFFLNRNNINRNNIKRKKNCLDKAEKLLLFFVLIYSTISGALWVFLSHVRPTADSGSVCTVAEYILRGEFPMQLPTYMGYNPQQYGLVFVLQWMFSCFGSGNYIPWQVMNIMLFPLMIFAGYRIIKLMAREQETAIYYLIMILGFLPFYFYLPYVYGDFPSVACGMVVMWQTIAYCKKDIEEDNTVEEVSKNFVMRCFFGSLFAAFGCLVRRNSVIVVIAVCLVLLVHAIRYRRGGWRALLMAGVMVISVWGVNQGVYAYYEHLSGQKISPGIPASCYIMMGLEDVADRGPGWFNGNNYMALVRTDYDCEAADAYGKEQIRLRLGELWRNKAYAIDFFRRKILSQWNMPDCYAFHETEYFTVENSELPRIVQEVYFGGLRELLTGYMNRYQFILYVLFAVAMGGMLFGKKQEISYYLLAAAIIGGLFFSVLWEAMSRYVLAYEGYMIPLAAIGMQKLQAWLDERHLKFLVF